VVERIPIVTLGESLFVTVQIDIDDRLATTLQDDLMERIVATGSRGVLIDISSMEVVDSFLGRMLAGIASMSRILDCEVVVIGMRPVVAITLVELGLSLPGVRTALNVGRGMALLDQTLTRLRVEGEHVDTQQYLEAEHVGAGQVAGGRVGGDDVSR
jgi:rsbT antagonist protein RsbS